MADAQHTPAEGSFAWFLAKGLDPYTGAPLKPGEKVRGPKRSSKRPEAKSAPKTGGSAKAAPHVVNYIPPKIGQGPGRVAGSIAINTDAIGPAIRNAAASLDRALSRPKALANGLRAARQQPEYVGGNSTLSTPPMSARSLAAGLRSFVNAMGGPLSTRMAAHGEQQKARMAAGDYSPTPLTGESIDLADSVAGSLVGNIGLAGALRAYHGSPHRFDKFDLGKIGTGEGAQAYGHGLYFAEKQGTAKAYQMALSGDNIESRNFFKDGSIVEGIGDIIVGSKEAARQAVPMPSDHANQIAKEIEDWVKKGRKASTFLKSHEVHEPYRAAYEAAAKAWEGVTYKKNKGALYTTSLNVEPEDLLDWDKPLSEQSAKVRAAVEHLLRPSKATSTADDELLAALMEGPGADELRAAADAMPDWNPTGAEIYRALFGGKTESVFGNSENAKKVSAALREAGIPGIRYLDQGSRGYKVRLSLKGKPYGDEPRDFATKAQADAYAAEKQAEGFQAEVAQDGTRNFVIFDDSLVDITHVDGKPLTKAERAEAVEAMMGGGDALPSAQKAGPLSDDAIREWAKSTEGKLGLKSFDVWPLKSGDLKLNMLEVPKDARKAGIGTKAMEELTQLADKEGRRIILSPGLKDDLHGTTSRSRLVAFYKRFGFVENKGRNKDFSISEGMYREPRKKPDA